MVQDELVEFVTEGHRGYLWALQGLDNDDFDRELRYWMKPLLECAEVDPSVGSDRAKWLLALTIRELADYFGRTPEGEEYLETPGLIEFDEAASLEEVRDAVVEVQDAVKRLEKVCQRKCLPGKPAPGSGLVNDAGPALPGCEELHNHKLGRIVYRISELRAWLGPQRTSTSDEVAR